MSLGPGKPLLPRRGHLVLVQLHGKSLHGSQEWLEDGIGSKIWIPDAVFSLEKIISATNKKIRVRNLLSRNRKGVKQR